MAKRRVQIVELPKAKTGQQVGYGLYNRLATMGGLSDSRPRNDLSVSKTIGGVPREEANLEAEGGETVMIPEIYGNVPTHFTITGPRHAQGGVPMNLPENSFIFSDFVDMKIKDPEVLNYFNKTTKKGGKGKGYTPADIAKQYDINKYIKILQDPNSDDIDKKTAELMIKNYNLKLGALGLVQEAQKGFEDGVPEVSEPFMDKMGISPADLGVVSPEAKELAGAIQQMIEQGIAIEEVIGQLLTQEIPPEIIMEALTVLGMDQEEAAALLEAVMMQVTESVEQPMQSQQESPYPEMPLDTQGVEIQNPEMMEEQSMSPEMMLYGGKVRKLKRKQMGGPAEMMAPEQMMGQPEMQQEDPMQEIMQQVTMGVEEMLQAGENINSIVMQLLQMQVPEEIIAQVLVQFGVSEQEIQQAFEVAMSHPEMQGGQDPMMDPNMQGQGISPDMMPAMDPSMAMMQMGGGTEDEGLEQMILEALEQGADPQQVIEILVQQGLDPERAQEAVMMVTQQMGQPMMRRGGSLPKYEKAGEVPKKYREDPRYNKTAEGFTYAGLKKGDYINLGNDEFIQLKVDIPEDFEFAGVTDEFASSKRSNVETALFQLAYFKELSKNPKLKEAFHKAYIDAIKDKNLFKSAEKGTTSSYFRNKNLEKVSPDELIDLYTKHVEANVSLYLKGLDPEDFTQDGKLDPKVNKDKYKDFVKDKADINLKNIYTKVGMKPEGLDIAKSQAAQWAYQKITSSPETYFADDQEMQQLVKDVLTTDPSFGVADEKGTGYQEKRISPIDGALGNTTIGHAGQVMLTGPKVKVPLVKDAEDVEESKDPSSPSYKPPSYVDLDWSPTHYAQYQDAINRRYLPNITLGMPDINMQTPGVHLDDWRQYANALTALEKQKKDAQLSMPGTGAQTRANIQGASGETAEGIVKKIADVKSANINRLNQAEGVAADVANRTNLARGTAWDRILQQMNQRTQEEWLAKRKSDTDAINVAAVATDDQAKRAGLMMSGQVAIDPRGFMYMHNPLDFYPEEPSTGSDVAAVYDQFYKSTRDREAAVNLTELHFGKGHYAKDRSVRPGDQNRMAAQEMYRMKYGKKGGSIGVLGSHVFPFMFY
jgi:hypothetical protein